MTFEFVFEGDPIEIISGQMLACDQLDCSDGAPLEEMGPQGFECTATGCSALALETLSAGLLFALLQ